MPVWIFVSVPAKLMQARVCLRISLPLPQVRRVPVHRGERGRRGGRGRAEEEDLRDEEDAGGALRHGHPVQQPHEERVSR